MLGYLNADFGDAIRSITNTASENETNLDKVHFNIKIFEQFSKAYLTEVNLIITAIEKKYLPFFALLITYEQLIRFYTDYIQHNIHYKVSYPEQNLQRAKVQLKLLEEMMLHFDEMKRIIDN
jgi:enoyl reductase-like protein